MRNHTIPILLSLLLPAADAFGQPRAGRASSYSHGVDGRFEDIYRTAEGNFALCGSVTEQMPPNQIIDYCWWLLIDEEGGVIAERTYRVPGAVMTGFSVIELDNGDFAIAGSVEGGDAAVMRIDSDGGQIWRRTYGGNRQDNFHAIIELKAGDLLACGSTRSFGDGGPDGYVVRIRPNADIVWQHTYGTVGSDRLSAIREVDGGAVLAGVSDGEGWLLKIDGEGEELWSRFPRPVVEDDTISGAFISLASCAGAGFFASGYARGIHHWFYRCDNDGEIVWSRTYPVNGENGLAALTYSGIRMPDGGFVSVGMEAYNGERNGGGSILRLNSEGDLLWRELISNGNWNVNAPYFVSYFSSVLPLPDGGIIACGPGYVNGRRPGGIVVRYVPDRSAPLFIRWTPENFVIRALAGETLEFTAVAEDAQGDAIRYLWLVDDAEFGADTALSYTFRLAGDSEVIVTASDEELNDSLIWHISVRDLFVYSHTPDTLELTLRRGTTQEFTLDSIAVTEGMPVSYAWTLTDIDNFDRFDLGEGSSVSVEFLRSGNYSVEVLAFRGEAQDNVVWTVRVRSAILDFLPGELNLSVLPDSLVNFEVIPFNPESDSLSFRWELDGDSVGAEAALGLRFAGDGDTIRSFRVAAMVFDGGEGDTVTWRVTVLPPAAVGEFGIGNLEFRMGEPAPNPFNATTTISYALDKPGRTRLSAFDLSGREVARLVDGSREAGVHSAVWEASGVPAGVYLLRLESGGRIAVRKSVLVR